MLDLNQVTKLLPGIGEHLREEAVARVFAELNRVPNKLCPCEHQEELVAAQEQWRDRIWFSAATPVEPLQSRILLQRPPSTHTVIATDGSQIAPNQHEIAYCYLLNIGRVILHYGQNRAPVLDSVPEVFYRPEDLYASRQWGIRTEEWMGYRRAVSEAQELATLGVELRRQYPDLPLLAMVDGSLIYWFLDTTSRGSPDGLSQCLPQP